MDNLERVGEELSELTECLLIQKSVLPSITRVMNVYRSSLERLLISPGSPGEQLELRFADYLGVAHCIALPQAMSCFTLVLEALDCTGEVLISPFGTSVPGEEIASSALSPVFCDCSRDTWNVSPADLARRITPNTSAILATHFAGNPCDLHSLALIADRAGINLIFDGTEALGATHGGRSIVGAGDASIISLPMLGPLQCGAGGVICTNHTKIALRLREAQRRLERSAISTDFGWTASCAAAAIAGLELLEGRVSRNRRIAQLYDRAFASCESVAKQSVGFFSSSTYSRYVLSITLSDGQAGADTICEALSTMGGHKGVRPLTPLYATAPLDAYRNIFDIPLPNADALGKSLISLPMDDQIDGRAAARIAVNLCNTLGILNGE